MYKIEFHNSVLSLDVPRLSINLLAILPQVIKEKLSERPEVFGKPLRNVLKVYRSLKVGDIRVVFKIIGKTVGILAIRHRKDVYNLVEKRS